ncbi:hypothetical protein HJFPF1_13010 [Paramyrothecium foliicola]|nr:hypothetical protein HJFPF1_13010 [Paramyrothecium foliicola]
MASIPTPNPLPPDENVGIPLLALSSTLIAFVIGTTCLRMFARIKNRAVGWDDYTICLATILAILRLGTQVAQSHHGNGRHRWYIDPHDYMLSNMYGWYAQLLLFSSICVLKISICLLILRIRGDRWLKILLYAVIAGLVVTNGGVIIILLAECKPVGYWRKGAVCWDNRIRIYSIYFTIAYSILTDLLCSLLPLVVIWNVRMTLRKKALVWALMSLGLLATGFGVARATSLGIVTVDLTWVYAIAAIWSNLELFLGIIAANLSLSVSMYKALFGAAHSLPNTYGQLSGTKLSFRPSRLRGDTYGVPETVVEAQNRRSSDNRSEQSDGSREPVIHKTTEFRMQELHIEEDKMHFVQEVPALPELLAGISSNATAGSSQTGTRNAMLNV